MLHIHSSDGTNRVALKIDNGRPAYQVEIWRDGHWDPAFDADSSLLSGPSFDLLAHELMQLPDGAAVGGNGESAAGDPFTWQASVSPIVNTGWLRFEVEIVSKGLSLSDIAPEPEILVELGALPPYERGDHVWFKTLVENPTQWNHEAQGNDFPATYFYDPYRKAEIQMFFDMTEMSWMSADNMARFYDYRCGVRRRFAGNPSMEIGLLGQTKSGSTFPDGLQRIVWYVSARHRMDSPSAPTEQAALVQLVSSSLPLLRSSAHYWPARSTSWRDFAQGTALDLMNSEHCWGSDEHGEHLLNYVDGRSDAWVNAMNARGLRFDGTGPCLESALWVLRPLDVLQTRLPDEPHGELQLRLERFVRRELKLPRSHMLTGVTDYTIPLGTWQYLYKIAESWEIYAARDDEEMLSLLHAEIEQVVIPLAESTQYLFPLQFDKSTLRKIGPGDGNAISGIFALLMLSLHERLGAEIYIDHAKRALRTLANLPIDAALQEVFLIAQAADAADRLRRITGDEEWSAHHQYFLAQTLRMMYWFDDRTSAATRQVSHLGMFLACANINYPAFLENIEVDARLAATLDINGPIGVETLKVLDYGRRNNFSFFPVSSPAMFGDMPLEYIPFEEVPILEGPIDAGFVGQEIYGAGWVFRAHLLWDALASSDDREVMVVSLDSYREGRHDEAKHDWSFVAYNSTPEERKAVVQFPMARGRTSFVHVGHQVHPLGVNGEVELMFAPEEALLISLKLA